MSLGGIRLRDQQRCCNNGTWDYDWYICVFKRMDFQCHCSLWEDLQKQPWPHGGLLTANRRIQTHEMIEMWLSRTNPMESIQDYHKSPLNKTWVFHSISQIQKNKHMDSHIQRYTGLLRKLQKGTSCQWRDEILPNVMIQTVSDCSFFIARWQNHRWIVQRFLGNHPLYPALNPLNLAGF